MKSSILIGLVCMGSLAAGSLALARPPGPNRPPPRPPAEAIDACKGKASGDSCSFESPHGAVSGTCWAPRQDLPLACRPARNPDGR